MTAPSPRVHSHPQLIGVCPINAVIASEQGSCRPLPNYITQEEAETPSHNTRSRREIPRTITHEALLVTMEMTTSRPTARNLASRKFPLQLLCEFAGAVMDSNGELLQYRHLMARPEYREVWGKAYGNEVGRLAQGLPGRVEGTHALDFIAKSEVPRKPIQRCNLRPDFLQLSNRKRRSKPSKMSCRRRQNQLPRRCSHTNM